MQENISFVFERSTSCTTFLILMSFGLAFLNKSSSKQLNVNENTLRELNTIQMKYIN